jgi:hypothetical protein
MQKDIDLIEGVQRRATKLVVGTKGMSYVGQSSLI